MRHLYLAAVLCLAASTLAYAEPPRTTVTIDDEAFAPKVLTVAPGTTVTWINRDSDPHTVVSVADPKAFKSPALDTGESFSFTFADAGTYAYFCSVHPHMQATVIVDSAARPH